MRIPIPVWQPAVWAKSMGEESGNCSSKMCALKVRFFCTLKARFISDWSREQLVGRIVRMDCHFRCFDAVRSVLFRDRLRNGVLTCASVQRDHLRSLRSDRFAHTINRHVKTNRNRREAAGGWRNPRILGACSENPVKISAKDSPHHRDVRLSTGPGLHKKLAHRIFRLMQMISTVLMSFDLIST